MYPAKVLIDNLKKLATEEASYIGDTPVQVRTRISDESEPVVKSLISYLTGVNASSYKELSDVDIVKHLLTLRGDVVDMVAAAGIVTNVYIREDSIYVGFTDRHSGVCFSQEITPLTQEAKDIYLESSIVVVQGLH